LVFLLETASYRFKKTTVILIGNVWRAVEGDVAKRYKKNTRVRWWAFTSCSKSISILKHFVPKSGNDGTIFMIECINGKNISAYSFYSNEDEIILMSGTTLVAMNESLPMNEIRVVHLKEVSAVTSSSTGLVRSFSTANLHAAPKPTTPIPLCKPAFMKEATTPSTHLPPKSAGPFKKPSGKRFYHWKIVWRETKVYIYIDKSYKKKAVSAIPAEL
jgi:hypothetical protein